MPPKYLSAKKYANKAVLFILSICYEFPGNQLKTVAILPLEKSVKSHWKRQKELSDSNAGDIFYRSIVANSYMRANF